MTLGHLGGSLEAGGEFEWGDDDDTACERARESVAKDVAKGCKRISASRSSVLGMRGGASNLQSRIAARGKLKGKTHYEPRFDEVFCRERKGGDQEGSDERGGSLIRTSDCGDGWKQLAGIPGKNGGQGVVAVQRSNG